MSGSELLSEALERQRALSRWDSEGGAGPSDSPIAAAERRTSVDKVGDPEFEALHVRIIALENLVIALLSKASDQELELVREMAAYISPRPGFTPHPLTIHAATHMLDLAERAARFNGREPS